MSKRLFLILGSLILIAVLLILGPALNRGNQVSAEPAVFASPVHAGCYLAGPGDCRIHVEPFTINIASGTHLVQFKLVAIQLPGGLQTTIYDWRPDQSNPAPASGSTYTPSLVAQDYAATCGNGYEISLQGRNTGDANLFNLGLTAQFNCPTGSMP